MNLQHYVPEKHAHIAACFFFALKWFHFTVKRCGLCCVNAIGYIAIAGKRQEVKT
jgi:hypothetical protein